MNGNSKTFGRYTLIRPIAQGGMGEVVLATQETLGGLQRPVVLKTVLPHLVRDADFRKRFVEEARLVTSLNHANIVQVYDAGEIDGTCFLAMEFVDGLDLRTLLQEHGEPGSRSVPLPVRLFILAEICSGLDYAHSRKGQGGQPLDIVHRDLSPSNVMLSRDGAVKLVDFGVAKVKGGMNLSISGSLRGKIRYMSPEQAHGRDLTGKSDVFSFGVVAFELLTGKRLFDSESEMTALERVRAAEVPSLSTLEPTLPAPLVTLVEGCLHCDPGQRPAPDSIRRDLLGLIHELTGGQGVTAQDLGRSVLAALPESAAPGNGPNAFGFTGLASGEASGNRTATLLPENVLHASLPPAEGLQTAGPAWNTGEVTAQDVAQVRSLASTVRWLIAAVVVLIGLNLFFVVQGTEESSSPENSALRPDASGTLASLPTQASEDILDSGIGQEEALPPMEPDTVSTRMKMEDWDREDRQAPAGESEDTALEKLVEVVPRPAEARVYANGKYLGTGPQKVAIKEGEVIRLSAKLEGYQVAQEKLDDPDAERIPLTLVPIPEGRLVFRYFPADAILALNGKPLKRGESNVVDIVLPIGEHTVELKSGDGSQRTTKTVTIRKGETEQLGTLKL